MLLFAQRNTYCTVYYTETLHKFYQQIITVLCVNELNLPNNKNESKLFKHRDRKVAAEQTAVILFYSTFNIRTIPKWTDMGNKDASCEIRITYSM